MRKAANTQQQRQTSSWLGSILSFNSTRKTKTDKVPARASTKETEKDLNPNAHSVTTLFALRQPSTSSLLKKRQKRQKRGTSWPLTSKGAGTTTPMASGAAAAAAAAPAPAPKPGSNKEEHECIVMGWGSAPTSPLGSSPGLALASLSLGNPKTSSLHKRRQLRRFVEQPLGPSGVCARSTGHEQPWSPHTCLNLNATPPDSPMWGFGAAHSPTKAPASASAPAAPASASAAPAATGIASPMATFSLFDSTPTPSTHGSQPTAESSSWAGTHFGFGDPEEKNHMSPRKSVASYC